MGGALGGAGRAAWILEWLRRKTQIRENPNKITQKDGIFPLIESK